MPRWTRLGDIALTDDLSDTEAARGSRAHEMLGLLREDSLEIQDLRRFLWELGHFDVQRMDQHQVLAALEHCLSTGMLGVLPWARMQEILFTPRSSDARAEGDAGGSAKQPSSPAPASKPPPKDPPEPRVRTDDLPSMKERHSPAFEPKGASSSPLAKTNAPPPTSAALQSIKAMANGQRPAPSSYLRKEYIDAHLKKFEEGASFLTKKGNLERYGREKLGMPDNSQFVMPKSQMDAVLRKANKDLSIVETELGIPKGSWQGSEMVRIDIPEPTKLNLRVPSGNELGANAEWLPGGQLPTGFDEAVIDQIPIGSYMEKPLW